MKSILIAVRILLQNRWLWLLLTLWPLGMAWLLSRSPGGIGAEDVPGWLQQECLYGWTVVAFAAGTMIGNEERSRRIALVLGRAVSRRAYIGALWLASLAALSLYTGSVMVSGALMHAPGPLLVRTSAAELAVGTILCSTCLLLSLLFPGVIASGVGLGAVGALGYLGGGEENGLALTSVIGLVSAGTEAASRQRLIAGLVEAIALAAVLFAVATLVFEHQDLSMKSE